ncbi:hypothetical protein M0805_006890 [Coniferiporia weirii]|nr:hypothetical protein M0805_006890 [Coniferiporia weirii]
MSLPIETPSRIWRRIEEGEARNGEMPSLPSLPGFDESNVDESQASMPEHPGSFFSNKPLAMKRNVAQTSSSSPRAVQLSSFRPTSCMSMPLSDGSAHATGSIPNSSRALHSPEYKTDEEDQGHEQAGREAGSINTSPRLHIVQGSEEEDGDDTSLTEALASVSRTPSPLHFPDTSFNIDESHIASPKHQNLDHSDGGEGSLIKSFSFKGRNFKDVAVRKPYDIRLPALSRSMSSLSSSTPSVVKSTHPLSEGESTNDPIDEEVQETIEGNDRKQQYEAVSSAGEDISIDGQDHGSSERVGTREPTFSSDDATPSVSEIRSVHLAPQIPSSALSTPMPGSHHRMFETQPEERVNIDDLATPLPRRKSFLLRVVNSTARPRLIFSTPHPRAIAQQPASELDGGFTPGPSYSRRLGPKPRLSHRLSQIHTFQPVISTNSSLPGCEVETIPSGTNASFVSTASSHDLTVHHRANASFDPVTGPQGVGRFNAGKLNTYLHGLNRRLQEENELLVDKVRSQITEIEALNEGLQRRELSGVMEDEGAERWVLEKEEMEKELHELRVSLEAKEKDLADEQKGRMRDKERWKERMVEVEEGVGVIVHDLEKRVECAETKAKSFMDAEIRIKDTELDLKNAKAECELLRQRAEQAERIMANEKDLGFELRRANDEKDALQRDLHSSALHLQESEEALTLSRTRTTDLEKEISSLRSTVRDLESNLRLSRESAEALREEYEEHRSQQRLLREELQKAQSLNAQLKTDLAIKECGLKDLQGQLSDVAERLMESEDALERANEQVAISADELVRERRTVQQLEDVLEESERKMSSNDRELGELREKLAVGSIGQSEGNSTFYKVDVRVLEAELFEANKEIGRLTTILSQEPALKVIEKAKDRRIDILEKENEELLNQLRPTRDLSANITPRPNASLSGISPMHKHFINISMKTPRTPGEPLHDTSWLMNVTGDVSTSHLLAEIGRLQEELDFANESVDDKLDKLEEAGLGIVGLTKALETARHRISSLEAQLAHLEDRESQRLLDEAIPHGREEIDIKGANPILSSNLSMQRRLAAVTAELESLRKRRDEEIACSLGEKVTLRDAANRLSTEIKYVKEELRAAEEKGHMAEKTKQQLQEELIKAKGAIDDLEGHLLSERNHLRILSAENAQALKGKDTILEKLEEIELKMEDTKDRMLQLKETNIRLETELKVERRSTALEQVLLGNRDIIEQLRLERSRLTDEHCNLQQRLAKASKLASELSAKHDNLQNSYDGRRRQLDLQAKEIEDLRALVAPQLYKSNQAHSDEHRIHTKDPEVHTKARDLEAELKRVQQQAASFGHDLRRLRDERDKVITHYRHEVEQHERTNKQNRAQLRLLKEQLAHRHKKYKLMTDTNGAMEALKLKHKKECKGLFVQIRYLKAKFTRESSLRDDLGYQKHYLLVLLSRFEKSEKRILSTIAQIGYPTSPASPPRLKLLKAAALAIVFILRTRRVSEVWREQRSAKEAVTEALENVRKGRLTKS